MNRNYRIVFNRKLGIHQVASEHTRAQGKGGTVVRAAGLAVALLAGLHLAPALAVDLTIAGGVSINSTGDADYGYIAVGSSGTGVASLTIDSSHTYTGSLLLTAGNVTEGSVTVSGTGSTLTFSGANIGTVAKGTLLIENGGTVGGSSMNIGYGHSGSGMVTVTGAGSTLNITDYLRVARVGDGILNIENGGKVSVNGLLTVGYGGNGTLNLLGTSGNRGILETAAIRGGSGAVTINGGILRATANKTDYFQNFTAGEVKIGSGGLFFDTQGFTIGTDIDLEGTGGLTKRGSGTLTLTGENIYSGGTTVEAGTLQIGDGGTTGSLSGNITNNSALVFNHSDAQTYAGIISGTGSFTKLGSGTLSITGSNSYDGNTTVEGGTLRFDSYTQSASQTLGISASSNTSYSKLAVTNTATFDADAKISVDVAGVNTLARGHLLKNVISAGTLTSTTFDVSDNSALLNFDAIRNGNAVDFLVASNSATGIRAAVIKSGAIATLGAADVLDNTLNNGATGDMANVLTALGKLATDSEVSQAATQTLPLLNSGVTQVTKGTLRLINRLLQNRQAVTSRGLSGGDAISNRAAWLQPFGSSINQDDRDGASGFDATTWGMAGGLEGDLNRITRVGIAYAYANSNVDGNTTLSGTKQHADIDSHVLALYGTKQLANNMAWMWQADVGQNSNSGTRHLNFGGLDRTATSDYKTYIAHVGASLEKTLTLSERTRVTPTLRADYTWLRADSYREQGANALNLNVDQQTNDALVIGADARIRHMLTAYSRIEANAGVGYDAINKVGNVVATYAGTPGQSFATQGIDHSPWLFAGGLAYVHNTTSGTEISVRYDVEGRRDYVNQSASVKAKWLF